MIAPGAHGIACREVAQRSMQFLGYRPALGEVGTLVPALLSVFPTAPGRRPRRPRPAAAAERARPGRPPRRLPGPPPRPPARRHSTEAGRRATPARPRAPKPSRWNDQRPRSWPLCLGAAYSPRRARLQSAAEPDEILSRYGQWHHYSELVGPGNFFFRHFYDLLE